MSQFDKVVYVHYVKVLLISIISIIFIFILLSSLGAPCSGAWLLRMLGKAQPTTSNLNLVNSEVFETTATPDEQDGVIKMADLVESLDTRELDIGEGEEIDYDGNYLGVCVFVCFLSC